MKNQHFYREIKDLARIWEVSKAVMSTGFPCMTRYEQIVRLLYLPIKVNGTYTITTIVWMFQLGGPTALGRFVSLFAPC